jgi:rare lipoprotein A
MRFTSHIRLPWINANAIGAGALLRPAVSHRRNIPQLLAITLAAASLAACANTAVSERSDWRSAPRHTAVAYHHVPSQPVSVVRRHEPMPSQDDVASAASGVASFYTESTKTANGETFNTHELTAAHPSLPFGTKLRVTNVTNGQSVTVRVNDRGPYVPGRVVDVSYAAADALGMVKRGVAKVKLDVVQ